MAQTCEKQNGRSQLMKHPVVPIIKLIQTGINVILYPVMSDLTDKQEPL